MCCVNGLGEVRWSSESHLCDNYGMKTFTVAGQPFQIEIVQMMRVSCDECGDAELYEIGPSTQRDVKNWAETHQHRHDPTAEEYIAMARELSISGWTGVSSSTSPPSAELRSGDTFIATATITSED